MSPDSRTAEFTLNSKTVSKALGTHTVIACLQVFSNWINAEPMECPAPTARRRTLRKDKFILRVTWNAW